MKANNVDVINAFRDKMEFLPIVKEIRFTSEGYNQIVADIYTDKTISVQLISLDQAYPGTIDRLFQDYKKERNGRYLIISAPYISKLSDELCRKYGIGYIDHSGNCFINLDNIYISDIGHENLYPKKDKVQNIFKSSSHVTSTIIRILMRDISIPWKLKSLSEEAGCSIGLVSRVKNNLCEQALAEMGEKGLKITNPMGVLNAWSKAYNIPKGKVINAYTLMSIPEFEKAASNVIKENDYAGCLTGFSGGARYAPVVRYSKVHLWLSGEHISEFMGKTNIKQVDSGANITIYIAEESDIFVDSREINGNIVASPIQTYLDLMQLKGRGEEMAEVILSKEIINDKG